MRETLRGAFWQLLVVYTVLVVLISLNLFWKYTLHFEIFAVVLAVLGAIALRHVGGGEDGGKKKAGESKTFVYLVLALGLVLMLMFRVIPYLGNGIPLGYDTGIYKYGIESFASSGFSVDSWVKGAFTPGFLYLMVPLVKMFSSDFILIWLYIGFTLLLGVAIYFFSKEYVGKKASLIAVLLYAVSIVQFKVFAFMYYKNIIALSCLLFALFFLKRSCKGAHPPTLNRAGKKYHTSSPPDRVGLSDNVGKSGRGNANGGFNWSRLWFIVFGVLTGIMHRPTFFIFGLAFISLTVQDYKNFGKNVLSGLLILVVTIAAYIGFWEEAIFPLFKPVAESFIEPGTAPGTFLSFFTYQFSTLFYLPFAILGFMYLAWKKQFNMLFFLTAITAIIVYFQFFFFNRFIIHLDVFMIVLAGSGFALLIENKKKLGVVVLVLMLFSAGFVTLQEARHVRPLISDDGLDLIESLGDRVEQDAMIMVLSSEYSPWVLAYSDRRTIAPGLFEENLWSAEQWEMFWNSQSELETRALVEVYDKPLYLFAGTKAFNNPCFEDFLDKGGNKLLRYRCEDG
ncbi:MAG: hypothetical protein ABIH92_00455 [Nanoarchaeota archaeon]